MFSFGVVKFWQGIVEVVLRVVSIVLILITFFASIAAASALSAERTSIQVIEDLRFDTRSPVGWTILLCLFALPLTIAALVMRFLDVQFITSRRRIFFIVDIIISTLLAVGYFCGAIPLAVRAGDWKFWRGRGSESDIDTFNINGIVSSTEATAAFAFLSTFTLVALVVWLVLFMLFNWGPPRSEDKGFSQIKVQTMAGSEEVSIEQKSQD